MKSYLKIESELSIIRYRTDPICALLEELMRNTLSYQTDKRYPVPSVYQNISKEWMIPEKETGSTFKQTSLINQDISVFQLGCVVHQAPFRVLQKVLWSFCILDMAHDCLSVTARCIVGDRCIVNDIKCNCKRNQSLNKTHVIAQLCYSGFCNEICIRGSSSIQPQAIETLYS